MRPPEFIASEWKHFQDRIERIHGSPMDGTEAMMLLELLLSKHRKDMLTNMVESWMPGEWIMLRDIIAKAEKPYQPPKAEEAGAVVTKKGKAVREAMEQL